MEENILDFNMYVVGKLCNHGSTLFSNKSKQSWQGFDPLIVFFQKTKFQAIIIPKHISYVQDEIRSSKAYYDQRIPHQNMAMGLCNRYMGLLFCTKTRWACKDSSFLGFYINYTIVAP
jgi:hypothetical protein